MRDGVGWSEMKVCEVRFQTLEGIMAGRMTRCENLKIWMMQYKITGIAT